MLLDDNPAVEDRFGYNRYVDVLYDVVIGVQSTPYCIGIFGPWGCGKTTLMRFLKERLSKDNHPTIWFNPWKYDNKEAIWSALLQTILSEMKQDIQRSQQEDADQLSKKISNVAKKLAWYTFKTGITNFSSGLISSEFLEDIRGAFTSTETSYEFINRFEDTFRDLVDKYRQGRVLVIFIDDLDRCVPENAVTVLEAIKIYLDKTSCIIIMGLEKEIVEKGIKARYRSEIEYSGKDYLEKIIQLPFYLPAAKKEAVMAYCKEIPSPCIPDREEGRRFYEILYAGTGGNIRKVKRFVNTLNILKSISGISWKDTIRMEILAKILLLQMSFPIIFREIEKNPALLTEINTQLRQGEFPNIERYAPNALDQDLLLDFLNKTKSVDEPTHLISECTSLTSQYNMD